MTTALTRFLASATLAFAATVGVPPLPKAAAAATLLQPARAGQPSLEASALTLLRLTRQPGGVAIVNGCGEIPAAPLGNADSVSQALQQVARRAAGYRVKEEGGAIDLLPPKGVTAGLLSTPVARFDYDGPKYAAIYAVNTVPEVARALRRIAPRTVEGGGGALAPRGMPPRIHLHVRNTTLLGILNAVAVAQGGGIWLIELRRCGGTTSAVIRSVSAGN